HLGIVKWRFTRKRLVYKDTQSEQISAVIDVVLRPIKLFRGEVAWCAYSSAGGGQRQVREIEMTCETKINNHRRPVGPHPNVCGLKVSMNDFLLMHREKSITHSRKESRDSLHVPRFTWDKYGRQILSFNKLLYNVMTLIARFRRKSVFDELNDIRMVDRLESLNLPIETVAFIVRRNHLKA